jgi:thymidine phosphorylase
MLPEAPVIYEVTAPRDGYVTAMNGHALGLAVVALGGGRQVESDVVNPAVGLSDVAALGLRVQKGQTLACVHAARESAAEVAAAAVRDAIAIGDVAPDLPPLVHERIG